MRRDYLIAITTCFLFLVSSNAFAEQVTLAWDLPTLNCDGSVIAAGEINRLEIYISSVSIPASDTITGCPLSGEVVDVPPTGGTVTVVPLPGATTTHTMDFATGTHFLRLRAGNADGQWSNFAGELPLTIAPPTPSAPTLRIIRL